MEPITTYIKTCQALGVSEFCAQHLYPFLVHCVRSGSLKPIDVTRGLTVDRLQLEPRGESDEAGAGGADQYRVAPLRPRPPRLIGTISVGCSSSCDVQINDVSLSKVHAYAERQGVTYMLWDNDSSAGTTVNGVRLEPGQKRELRPGDQMSLGYVDLIFLYPNQLYDLARMLYGSPLFR